MSPGAEMHVDAAHSSGAAGMQPESPAMAPGMLPQWHGAGTWHRGKDKESCAERLAKAMRAQGLRIVLRMLDMIGTGGAGTRA